MSGTGEKRANKEILRHSKTSNVQVRPIPQKRPLLRGRKGRPAGLERKLAEKSAQRRCSGGPGNDEEPKGLCFMCPEEKHLALLKEESGSS